jgi:hypothetical protein
VLCSQLANELRRHTVDAWFAHGSNGISGGEDWSQRLMDEIRRCDVMIVLASKHIGHSSWCHREAVMAADLGKHLFVVRVDDHPLPPWAQFICGNRQHLSLERLTLQAIAPELAQRVRDAVEGHLNLGEDHSHIEELSYEVAARGSIVPVSIRRAERNEVVQVAIPPAGNSQTVRVPLGGESSLTVYVRVTPSEVFETLPGGKDVLTWVALDADALETAPVVTIHTLDGPRQYPLGTVARTPGSRIRIRGAGIGKRGGDRGDLVVEIRLKGDARLAPSTTVELQELHDRLTVWSHVVVVAAPVLAVFAACSLGPVFVALSAVGFTVLGVWIACRFLASSRLGPVDWGIGIGAMLCILPLVGPSLFLWCGWSLQSGLTQLQLRRALVGLAGSGTLMWAFALAAKGSESDWWRLPIIVCIAGVGYFAFTVRGLVDART